MPPFQQHGARALACALLLPATVAGAETGTDNTALQLSHRTSLRAEAYTGTRSLEPGETDSAAAAFSVWTSGQLRAPQGQLAWNATARAQNRLGGVPTGRLRELYWRQPIGDVEFRLGRLMPAWGRTDGWNPTDNLSPRDFRLLAPEMQDQRFGREGLQTTWSLPGDRGQISAFIFAAGASHRLPLAKKPGMQVVQQQAPGRADAAIKWERFGQGWDISVSYLRGADLAPDLRLSGASAQGAQLTLSNTRQEVAGADASWQSGALVWRGEAAYSRPVARHGDDPFERKKPSAWLVAGPEWTGGPWTLGVQGLWQRTWNFQNPGTAITDPLRREAALYQSVLANQSARRQAGLTLRVAHRAFNDTLQSELATLVLRPLGPDRIDGAAHGVVRAKTSYAIDDAWTLQLGLDCPFGPERSFFGLWKENRLAYLQLRRDH